MPLVLDIETAPTAAALDRPYPTRKPPANYKSEETIAKWRAEDEVKWQDERIKEYSLNPLHGRIVCFGWLDTDTEQDGVLLAERESDEEELLVNAWELIAEHDGNVVTWNGSWDLQFIRNRSIMHGIVPTIGAYTINRWFKKYSVRPHTDCKAFLLNGDQRANEGLGVWAKALNVPGKLDGMSGADVWGLVAGGMFEEVAEYCLADVRATAAIYARIRPYCDDVSYSAMARLVDA